MTNDRHMFNPSFILFDSDRWGPYTDTEQEIRKNKKYY